MQGKIKRNEDVKVQNQDTDQKKTRLPHNRLWQSS